MNLPRLRFKEFSGKWENRPLSEIVGRLESGVSVNSEDVAIRSMYEYGILKTSCIANGYFFAHENKKIIPSEIARAKLNPAEDSILVSRMNTPQLVGEVGYVSKSYPNLFIPDRLWLIEVKNKYRDSTKWLSQQLTTKYLKNVLTNIATGTSGSMKNIAQPNFLSIGLSTPEFAEQTKIANFLTAVDEKIAQLTQKGDLLARYKKGVMQQIFSQQLRFKDDDGREFPEWEEKKLKDVVQNFIVPMRDKPKNLQGSIPWCRIEDFEGKDLFQSKSGQGVSKDTIKSMNLKVYPVNTLLVSCSANLGICAVVKRELITNQTFIGLVPHHDLLDINFFYYLMGLSSKRLNVLSSGTTISYLSREQFENFIISTPKLSEQTKIANFLTALDDKINHNQTKLNALKQYKQGLLQQLFV